MILFNVLTLHASIKKTSNLPNFENMLNERKNYV